MGDYLDKLSAFVADTRYEDLSEDAVAAVRDVVLDTVGAMVAGSRLPENANLARVVVERSGPATATIIGHPLMAEPMLATLVNGTAGVGLEMDEGNRFGGGHPSIHVTPGALAVAEQMGVDARRWIEAVLVGYEVESRLGGATTVRPNVHSHGHWGVIGTAVAVAKLKGYSADDVRSLINVASGMTPANTWTPCFEGATIRNAYPGRSGLMGILAVDMHRCGYTGVKDGPTDVFGTILGDAFDREAMVDGLGGEYRVQQNYFKFYACCRINHPAIEAALDLRGVEGFAIEDVEKVEVGLRRHLEGMVGDYPQSMLAAKFNVPFAVATALVRGKADITTFYPEAINTDQVRDLAAKVHVGPDTETMDQPDGPTARMWVTLKGGRKLSNTINLVPGDYGNRVPREKLVDKFRFLTADILGAQRAQEVIQTVDSLQDLRDMRELTSLIGGPSLA